MQWVTACDCLQTCAVCWLHLFGAHLCLAGAYGFSVTDQPSLHAINKAGAADIRENPVFDNTSSVLESTDTWPFDDMSCYAPIALQHTHSTEKSVHLASKTSVITEQKFNMMEKADSAWETLHREDYLRRCSDSSGSTVMCDTSFIKHVGDKLFDKIAK